MQNSETVKKNMECGTLAAILCMALDQLHKFTMLDILDYEKVGKTEITGFFNMVMVWNRGISFGMFQGMEYSNYFFMGFASIIIIIVFYLIKKANSRLEAIALGMIIGGACGNLIDRIRFGAVADFFDFYIGTYHWPAFNIADSCVFIGAALLIGNTLFRRDKNEKHS